MNNMKIVAATGNKHKIDEIESITKKFGMNVITKAEAGVGDLEVEETGTTFEENSLIKAEAIMKATGMPAIADDSGLEADALNGAPGVYSARFSGEGATDESNNAKLLKLMENIPDDERSARFVSVVTLCFPDGTVVAARGECPGTLRRSPRGDGGFGYDPLFVPVGYDKTYAEISAEEKNIISHRAKALGILRMKLKETGFEESEE
ncbi:MAG: RdgB/HAM1 family non-canonical purine NTP pyrophosphatase [Anaerovoracaceae bacterium]|nr:RdgB/HAM1 family non-canonical purine NTP pyrophosphatase [Anaerovoracaceae bacterium]